MNHKIDVAINVYGKPYQTAVTLFSLLKYSGDYIDKIYFIQENQHPYGVNENDFDFIKEILRGKIIYYMPKFYLGIFPTLKIFHPLLVFKYFRHSIRYQYAWEHTDKKYLFITHNDVLYTDDIITFFHEKISGNIGIGEIGQCWNCSASYADVCCSENYRSYRPTYSEFMELTKCFPPKRRVFEKIKHSERVWPLPECRLNEWVCMINMDLAKPVTVPLGRATPFGLMRHDIGTKWFNDIHQIGFLAKNIELSGYAQHDWANLGGGGGNFTLVDQDKYLDAEQVAKSFLEREYPDTLARISH